MLARLSQTCLRAALSFGDILYPFSRGGGVNRSDVDPLT